MVATTTITISTKEIPAARRGRRMTVVVRAEVGGGGRVGRLFDYGQSFGRRLRKRSPVFTEG